MDQKLKDKFWQEFKVPTQEEDLTFPFANPSDAARSLISARNWTGTITEDLSNVAYKKSQAKLTATTLEKEIASKERLILVKILQQGSLPTWASKNKEIQQSYIWSQMTEEELAILQQDYTNLEGINYAIDALTSEESSLNKMLEVLEYTTNWLVQYINWSKFEAREHESSRTR